MSGLSFSHFCLNGTRRSDPSAMEELMDEHLSHESSVQIRARGGLQEISRDRRVGCLVKSSCAQFAIDKADVQR